MDLNQTILIADTYIPHTIFYLKMLQEKGVSIERHSADYIRKGVTIITAEDHVKKYIIKYFDVQVTYDKGYIQMFTILSDKKN